MKVNQIDEEQVKKELQNCPLVVRQYVKALEQVCISKQEIIDKAIKKIKELVK